MKLKVKLRKIVNVKLRVEVKVNVKVTVKVRVPPEEGSTSAERCRGSFSPPAPGSVPDARAPTPGPADRSKNQRARCFFTRLR